MVAELINRRRRQLLVHSCLYYEMNTNLIDDATFDKWSYELAELQRKYPVESDNCVYAEAFKGFEGGSGFNLPYTLPEIVQTAERLRKGRYQCVSTP